MPLFNLDAIKNEFNVNISLIYNFTSATNQTLFGDLETEIENDFGWTVDLFSYCLVGIGFMLGITLCCLILKKAILVRHYRKGKNMPKGDLSIFLERKPIHPTRNFTYSSRNRRLFCTLPLCTA